MKNRLKAILDLKTGRSITFPTDRQTKRALSYARHNLSQAGHVNEQDFPDEYFNV